MSKLFKLKKWLTIEESAKHLSGVLSESVNEADVLRLALDGRLKLSVNFVNHADAKIGRIVPISEARRIRGISSKSTFGHHQFQGFLLNNEEVLEFDDVTEPLVGVFDLPLLGGDRLDVEQAYQMATNGPSVTLQEPHGTFVLDTKGRYCQVQKHMDDFDLPVPYSPRPGVKLIQANFNVETDQGAGPKKRPIWHEIVIAQSTADYFHPAASLPRDSVLVVRTDALTDFLKSVDDTPPTMEKPLTSRERDTLLTIIAVLAKAAKVPLDDYRKPGKAAGYIEGLTDEFGAHVSKRAIEDHLKKIPDALGTRMK